MQKNDNLENPYPSLGEVLLYKTADGTTRVEVQFHNETLWMSLVQMAELFQKDKSTISKHIKKIFEEGELNPKATVAKYATVQNEGDRSVKRDIEYYNLDVIISVGYRVKSIRGTQFRIWANSVLKEYLIKGFAMNDDLLKEAGGGRYFKELLERIRDIRASEKVFYRQVLDIFPGVPPIPNEYAGLTAINPAMIAL
ncbi:MAG: virulence RhuM family protein [Synergistaceae bacterium]|nr:virulence RhuM family protein [Synergistaceae bacterium]